MMSQRTEFMLFIGMVLGLAAAYLSCGAIAAWVLGLSEWSVTWWLFVAVWPAPVAMMVFVAGLLLMFLAGVLRAIVGW
jgi:hypothetical protein